MTHITIGHTAGRPIVVAYNAETNLWRADESDPPWRVFKTLNGCVRYVKRCYAETQKKFPACGTDVTWVDL